MKDDLEKFIERRKRTDREFAKDFEAGYQEFKIGLLLRQAREQAGVTQELLAKRTKTRKSAISRLENHAQDVRLSTLERVARALGKTLRIELVEAPIGAPSHRYPKPACGSAGNEKDPGQGPAEA